jgi:3-keto-disaccharide hydrolase
MRAVAVCLLLFFQVQARTWNFDGDRSGAIAPKFINEVGDWKVAADTDAPTKPNVLAQLAKSSGSIFNVTLIEDTNYKDVDISVSMKAVAGNTDQGGGLVWRAKDARNYYIARYNPLEDNYRVYKVEGGRRSELQSANIRKSVGWHTLRISMVGDHIECYHDGRKYLDVKDATFPGSGKIGLWTKADAQTHFDNLSVSGK